MERLYPEGMVVVADQTSQRLVAAQLTMYLPGGPAPMNLCLTAGYADSGPVSWQTVSHERIEPLFPGDPNHGYL